jgi:hypothetical protein
MSATRLPLFDFWRGKALLIDHTSPPLVIDWPHLKPPFNVPLGPKPNEFIIDVSRYRKVNILVTCIQGTDPSWTEIIFGVLFSKRPLGYSIKLPLDEKVHTLDIGGPQFRCNLLSPAKTKDPPLACRAQLYLFFTP